MTAHPFQVVVDKLAHHPNLVNNITCSIGLIQNFNHDPAGTLLIAIDVDLSVPQSGAWQLYRLLTGKEVDRDR